MYPNKINVLQNSNLKIQTKLTDVRVDFANGKHTAAGVGRGVRAWVPGRHDDDHDDDHDVDDHVNEDQEGDRMRVLPRVPHVGVVSADAGTAGAAGNHTWATL